MIGSIGREVLMCDEEQSVSLPLTLTQIYSLFFLSALFLFPLSLPILSVSPLSHSVSMFVCVNVNVRACVYFLVVWSVLPTTPERKTVRERERGEDKKIDRHAYLWTSILR